MSAQHTPGPWHQGVGDHQYCVYDKKCWINPDGSRGGETPNLVVVVAPESAVADARLISAAPEVLMALTTLRDVTRAMECENDSEKPTEAEYQDALAAADSAIAKAGGAS